MGFDDRLLTVLAQPSSDPHDCAVRWRQLVDLLARAGRDPEGPLIDEAMTALRTDWQRVAEPLRAAAARAVADRELPLRLLAAFASDSLAVSAPVLAAARLNSAEWQRVLAHATEDSVRFVASVHSELQPKAGERPAAEQQRAAAPPREAASSEPIPSISDVLARIERLRRQRERERGIRPDIGPDQTAGAQPALFRWECGPSGELEWVEGVPRGALIGRSIVRGGEDEGVDSRVQRAFELRAPFLDATLTLAGEGPVAGEWKISGRPAFEPTRGRFAGYRGVAVRAVNEGSRAPAGQTDPLDAASMRELVHEVRTPLNAIIGFAEIIDGQLLGPADRQYRERAVEIVRQARLLLSAIDDLDFVARAQSNQGAEHWSTDLGELLDGMVGSLRELAAAQGSILDAALGTRHLPVAADPELAGRLIARMCSGVIGLAEPGERLRLSVEDLENGCRVAITKPAAISAFSDEELFRAGDEDPTFDFTLRLVRGLARIADVDLVVSPDSVGLIFPRA